MRAANKGLLGGVCAMVVGISSPAQATDPPPVKTNASAFSNSLPRVNVADSGWNARPRQVDDDPPVVKIEKPEVLDYEDGQPIPAGYRIRERVRLGMVIPGALLWTGSYLGAVIYGTLASGYGSPSTHYELAAIPLVGPYIVGAYPNGTIFLADGIIQTLSAALLVGGIVLKNKELVRTDMTKFVQPEVLVGPGSIGLKLTF